MLQCDLYFPNPGYKAFEVKLHNQDVRALLKANEHHRLFADLWADDRITVVEARDADEARAIAAKRYPPDDGFVISTVEIFSGR